MSDRRVFDYQVTEYQLFYDRYEYTEWIDYYSYEFLWGYILRTLRDEFGIPTHAIFWGISFLFILVASLILVRKYQALPLLLLVNPLVVDVAFSQLRVALAATALGTAFLLPKAFRPLRITLAIVSLFIHSAAPLFLITYIAAALWSKKESGEQLGRLPILILTGIAIGLLIGPLRYDILSSIGDRRAEYTDISSSTSFLLPWVALLLLAVIDWSSVKLQLESRIAIVVLSLVATNLFTDGYSTRFIAVFFPFLASLLLIVNRRFIGLPMIAFICYSIYQWVLWFQM